MSVDDEADRVQKGLDEIKKKLNAGLKQPDLPTQTLMEWLQKHWTEKEQRIVQMYLNLLSNFDRDSLEWKHIYHEYEKFIEVPCLIRCLSSPVESWPVHAREHQQEWLRWLQYLKLHPEGLPWKDPNVQPKDSQVFVSSFYGWEPNQRIIHAGDTLEFVNLDPPYYQGHFVIHLPTQAVRGRAFESGEIAGEKSWTWTFNEPGIFGYSCVHKGSKCGEVANVIVLAPDQSLEDAVNEYEQSRKVTPIVAV